MAISRYYQEEWCQGIIHFEWLSMISYTERDQIKYENISGNECDIQKFWAKYPGYELSLKTYL